MNDTAQQEFFSRLVQDVYAEKITALHIMSDEASEGRVLLRAQHLDGSSALVRVYRGELPVPEHLRACGARDQAGWLASRAATLFWLEQQGHPAPQVIPTRSGTLIGQRAGWCTLMTTFLAGTVITPTLEQLRLLGLVLGRLHCVLVDTPADAPPVGKSFWYPALAFPQTLERLAFAEPHAQPAWEPLLGACRQTIQRLHQQQDRLPRAIIHGDAWPANAIQTAPDQVALVDWDVSGLGPALFDLGKLLLEGHVQSAAPPDDALAWHIRPDQERVHAIVDGYCSQRWLTPAELDLLLEAVRFGIAFIGAIHFAAVVRLGATASLERRSARLQNRFAVSEEIAMLAQRRIRQMQG